MTALVSKRRGPLSGVRVLDLSRVLAGPLCSMILGDLGAEVIKIEDREGGDQTRTIPPFVNGESHYFIANNRNKKSVALDARSPEGRELLLKIAAGCDVVLENFRPGVMDRLGLGYERLKEANPDIIVCSISGFGSTGPMCDKPSFDLVTQALSGVMSINGHPDGPPTKLGLPLGDIGGGLWAAIGVLAALAERNATGRGCRVDLSLLEGLMGLLGYLGEMYLVTGENPGRMGSSHHSIVPYGLVPAKDGHLVLALHVGTFWRNFCRAIGREDLVVDPRFRTVKDRFKNRAELEAMINDVMLTRTVAEWQAILDAADVPHGPVNNIGQALNQDVVRARGFIKETRHPVAGTVRVVGSPLHFAGCYDAQPLDPPPLLGEHTREVLQELAGLAEADIERLIASGVISMAEANPSPTAGPGSETAARDHTSAGEKEMQ
ncbi:MAG: CoA transferase [Betaproteobacteria bacterium]|nr:CoA transferase [Betaproteobacteria bacterium]